MLVGPPSLGNVEMPTVLLPSCRGLGRESSVSPLLVLLSWVCHTTLPSFSELLGVGSRVFFVFKVHTDPSANSSLSLSLILSFPQRKEI